MAIIYTTHYMEEAERLCDRIAIIDHGRIIAEGTKDELIEGAFGGAARCWRGLREGRKRLRRGCAARRARDGRGGGVYDRAGDGDCAAAGGCDEGGAGTGRRSLRRPNLESVFLHLTGRELRD